MSPEVGKSYKVQKQQVDVLYEKSASKQVKPKSKAKMPGFNVFARLTKAKVENSKFRSMVTSDHNSPNTRRRMEK